MKEKIIRGLVLFSLVFGLLGFSRDSQASGWIEPDPNFGTNSIATAPLYPDSSYTNTAMGAVELPDGKVVTLTTASKTNNYWSYLTRFNIDGTIDLSFSSDGRVELLSNRSESIDSWAKPQIISLNDGNVAVIDGSSKYFTFKVVNYNGQVVGTKYITEIVSTYTRIDGIYFAGLPGTFFVVGSKTTTGIAKYNSDLSRDLVFGRLDIPSGGVISITAMSNGDFYVLSSVSSQLVVRRYLANKELDLTFGSNGVFTSPVLSGTQLASLAIDKSSGKIWLTAGLGSDMTMIGLNSDGQLNPSFGNNGLIIENNYNMGKLIYHTGLQKLIMINAYGGDGFTLYDPDTGIKDISSTTPFWIGYTYYNHFYETSDGSILIPSSGKNVVQKLLIEVNTEPELVTTTTVAPETIFNDVWQNISNSPTFSWSPVANATSYDVYWGTDANAETGTNQVETTFTPSAVTTGTYYLRISSKNDLGSSAWQTVFTFRYDGDFPSYVENATVVETHGIVYGAESSVLKPSFTWSAPSEIGSGIAGYNVYFGNYLGGTSETFVAEPAYAVANSVLGSEIYYLRLQTVDEAGNVSSWRTVFLYEYVPGAAPANVGSVTEINGYENDTWHGLSQNTPTFSWVAPDPAITSYAVYWGTDINGTSDVYQSELSYTPGAIVVDGTYYLRIQTKDDTEQVSPWTTLYTYKFDGSIPANVTYPVLEINGAVNNTCQDSVRRPAFSWNKPNDFGSGVSAYRAYFGKSLDEVILPEATTIYTEGFALNNDVAGGLYTLRLQALDAAGNASDWQLAHVYCYASASGYVTSTTSLELTTSLPDDPDGQLVVELPADMHDDTLQVLIYPVAERVGIPAQFSVVGNQFEIEAISQTTNENVTQFDLEYTISYHYNDEDILGLDETTLKVYYHNPVSGEWEALASSTVDTVNNIVSATIDHMSEFAIFGTIAIGDANITVLSGGAPNILDSLITFETKTLTGEIQQALGSIAEPWVAKDPSGSGNGWHVEIAASDFISGSHSIAISNAQIKQSPANISLVYGNAIPSSTQEFFTPLGSTPVKLLTAAQDTGMGTYNFSPEFTLTIPANAFAGTYLAPVTLSIITAP